jgi:hypothetical protein
LAPLKEVAADEGYGGSLFSFYAQRAWISIYFLIAKKRLVVLLFRSTGVKNRLRVIFIIDCAQPTYETVLETHPSMYKYSDAIWMENWTKISMTAVAARILK